MNTTNEYIRNKQLSNAQIEQLRKKPQYLQIEGQPEFLLYNLVNKESTSGLFKNQRLFILNLKKQSVSYLSKVPPGLIPFYSFQQVQKLLPKETIFQHQVVEHNINKMAIIELKENNVIEIRLKKSNKKVQWIMYFDNKNLMHEWYSHLTLLFYASRKDIDLAYHTKNEEPSVQEKQISIKAPQQPKYPLNSPKDLSKHSNSMFKSIQKSLQEVQEIDQQQPPSASNKSNRSPLKSPGLLQVESQSWKEQISSVNDKKDENQSELLEIQQHMLLASLTKDKHPLVASEPTNKQPQSEEVDMREQDFDFQVKPVPNDSDRNERTFAKSNKVNYYTPEPISRSGVIKKNTPSFCSPTFQKEPLSPPKPSKDWNKLYSGSPSKGFIYFQFIEQCLLYIHTLLDSLPFDKSFLSDHPPNPEGYLQMFNNGIQYKMVLKNLKQDSLIKQLTEEAPIVGDMYQLVGQLKGQFNSLKAAFQHDEEQVPLIAFVQYMTVPILCKAQGKNTSGPKKQNKKQNFVEESILRRIDQGQMHIISSADLQEQMRKNDTISLDWVYLFEYCQCDYFTLIFLSEMYIQIFLNIFRSELYQLYFNFPADFPQQNTNSVEDIVMGSVWHLLSQIGENSRQSQKLWKVATREAQRLYRVKTERIDNNYMIEGLMRRIGLQFEGQYGQKNIKNLLQPLSKQLSKLRQPSKTTFRPLVNCLNYQSMSPYTSSTQRLSYLQTQQLFDFRSQLSSKLPKQINYMLSQIDFYLCCNIIYTTNRPNQSYKILNQMRPSLYKYKTAIQAVKWLIREQQGTEAGQMTFKSIEEIVYYVGKAPLVSEFYQAIAEEQLKQGQTQKALLSYQKSIQNLADIYQSYNPSLIYNKRKYISQIYLKLNRKAEALKQLHAIENSLRKHSNPNQKQLISVLQLISKVYLTMGKLTQSINYGLQCMSSIQQEQLKVKKDKQEKNILKHFMNSTQTLLRCFQLAKRSQESFGIAKLCLQRAKSIKDSPKPVSRLLRMFLYPHFKICDLEQSQNFIPLLSDLSKLYKQCKLNDTILFQWLKQHQTLETMELKLPHYIKNVKSFYLKIQKLKLVQHFKDEMQYYFEESSHERNETIGFLKDMFIMSNLVGTSFLLALLKDPYYSNS